MEIVVLGEQLKHDVVIENSVQQEWMTPSKNLMTCGGHFQNKKIVESH